MFVEKRWAFMVSFITQFGNYFENQGCFSFTYIIYYMFSGQWTLMTLLNPTFVYNLICIGYPGDPSSAIRVTRRRHADPDNNIQKEMYCSASFLVLWRLENLHYWILWLEGILVVTLRFLVTPLIIEHHLIVVEFSMQAIFWSLQSNQRGSLCCKCCWYF
jgi:hypothetical protein